LSSILSRIRNFFKHKRILAQEIFPLRNNVQIRLVRREGDLLQFFIESEEKPTLYVFDEETLQKFCRTIIEFLGIEVTRFEVMES